ncbi:MAG: hypothetical protein WCV67_03030 [Victivallaceae bacterium]|jgi:hypothetical protein
MRNIRFKQTNKVTGEVYYFGFQRTSTGGFLNENSNRPVAGEDWTDPEMLENNLKRTLLSGFKYCPQSGCFEDYKRLETTAAFQALQISHDIIAGKGVIQIEIPITNGLDKGVFGCVLQIIKKSLNKD